MTDFKTKGDRSGWSQILLHRSRLFPEVVSAINEVSEELNIPPTAAVNLLIKHVVKIRDSRDSSMPGSSRSSLLSPAQVAITESTGKKKAGHVG